MKKSEFKGVGTVTTKGKTFNVAMKGSVTETPKRKRAYHSRNRVARLGLMKQILALAVEGVIPPEEKLVRVRLNTGRKGTPVYVFMTKRIHDSFKIGENNSVMLVNIQEMVFNTVTGKAR